MSDDKNKPENTDAPTADTGPTGDMGTLPETSLTLEEDTPVAAAPETPEETPAEVPTETPAEVPVETPTEVPAETPTETPAPTPTTPPATPQEPEVLTTPDSSLTLQSDTVEETIAQTPAPEGDMSMPAATDAVENAEGQDADIAQTPEPTDDDMSMPQAPALDNAAQQTDVTPDDIATVPPATAAPEAMPTADINTLSEDLEDDNLEDIDDTEDGFADDAMNEDAPKSKKKMMMVGGIALALAVAGGGGYMFLSGDDTTTKVASTATTNNATTTTAQNTVADPFGMGFTAPPQPDVIQKGENTPAGTTDDTTGGFDFAAADPLIPQDTLETPPSDDFSLPITTDGAENAETIDGLDTADTSVDGAPDDFWTTAENVEAETLTPSETETSETAESTDGAVALSELDDPLSLPPLDAENDAIPVDALTTSEAGEDDDDSIEPIMSEIPEDTAVENAATDGATATETTETTETADTAETADSAVTPALDTAETTVEAPADATDVSLPSFDPIPEDTGPEILATEDEPPQLGLDMPAVPTLENTTAQPDIQAAIAPQKQTGTPPKDISAILPPVATPNGAAPTPAAGTMENNAVSSYRDALKEVPAQEAIIRPLPKKYLLMRQSRNKQKTEKQRIHKAVNSAQPDAALGVLNKMSAENPNDTRILMQRAIAAQRAGQNQSALRNYETILKKNPSDLKALTNMLGLLRKEKPHLALEKLSELRSIYPEDPGIAAQLAVSYGSVQQYDNALRYFDVAASLDRPNAYYPFNKAIILDRMGRSGEATALYRQALKMHSEGHIGKQKISVPALRKRLGMAY